MYKWESEVQWILRTAKLKKLVPHALHRGPSGRKSGMWKSRRTLVGAVIHKFPYRGYQELPIREASNKLVNRIKEVVGV